MRGNSALPWSAGAAIDFIVVERGGVEIKRGPWLRCAEVRRSAVICELLRWRELRTYAEAM